MAISRFLSPPLLKRLLGFFLATAFLMGLYAFGVWVRDPYHCRMAEGVRIGSLDVSGMTRREARQALEASLEDTLYRQPLELQLPEETLLLSPEDIQPRVHVRSAVRTAYACGREDAQSQKQIGLGPFLTLSEDALRKVLEDYAGKYDTVLTEPSWTVTGERPELSTASPPADTTSQTLHVTLGFPQAELNIARVCRQIRSMYVCAPEKCAANQYTLSVPVIPSALPSRPDVQHIWEEFCTLPVNDSLDLQSYEFVPGSYGFSFDPEQLQAAIDGAGYGETVSVPFFCTKPEITGDQVYFRDVLGSCETKHNTNENRNNNLRLLCKAMDGFILQPGKTFSYNGVVGERTREKGYLPAPAYSGNRLVDSVGGGVCQGSTTLYNCALLADLEIVFRACHGASVSYVPPGLDATVNWGTTDFQFRNNFHFPIMIRAEVAEGYVKMQLLGTDEKDYYIKMETRSGEDDLAVYARSYRCRYSNDTDELLSRDFEAYSTYYKNIG